MKAFPEAGSECAPAVVSNTIDLRISPNNAAQLNTAVLALSDSGNGTPTGAAIRVATNYLNGLAATDDRRKFILLATDGEPSCYGAPGAIQKDMASNHPTARAEALAAVNEAASAGIHTFVVGVATTANDGITLNALAVAGLEPSPDMRPGAPRYYLGTDQASLFLALESVVSPVASNCVFPLKTKPPVPDNIAVKVNGAKSPHDPGHADGWDYTDPNLTALQVYGSWCDMIKANGNMVEITYGCLNEIIP
jgi:hypothetical protein